jgi:hypothetical protein
MAGPKLPPFPTSPTLLAAGGPDDQTIRQYESVIAAANQSGAVAWTNLGFAVDASRLPSGWDVIVKASATQANRNPTAGLHWMQPAGGPSLLAVDPTKIDGILKKIFDEFDVLEKTRDDITAIAKGALKSSAHWWGLEVMLNKEGAAALSRLLGTDLPKVVAGISPVLAAVGVSIPAVAVVAGIVGTVGTVLSKWVDAENKGNAGVTITLYFYVVPYVRATQAQGVAPVVRTDSPPSGLSSEDLEKIWSGP